MAGRAPFRHPAVPFLKYRIGQVILPPVQAGIYTYLIALGAYNIAENAGNFRQTAAAQHKLAVFFQIIEHRQIRIMSLQQAHRVSALVHSHVRRHRVRVKVYAIGNAQALTFRHIARPLSIVLFRQIHTETAANDGKINPSRLYGLPIDHTLMMAHINAPVTACRKRAHTVRHIKVQNILILIDAGTILVTPAIFLTGLR